MYRKAIIFIYLVLPFCLTQATEYKQGEDYIELKGSLTAQKEITEYFSFYCPACFGQEPFMNELKASLPIDAIFKKNHVDGMPGKDKEIEYSLTKALITAQHLGIDETIIPAIFNRLHIDHKGFNSDEDIKALFITKGVSEERFDKVFSSFSVNTQAKRMQRNTENIRRQGYSGVPTLVVNGKYKPLTDNVKSTEEYKELIHFLFNKH
jgi:thiol:disulfide interchange protein DsbA